MNFVNTGVWVLGFKRNFLTIWISFFRILGSGKGVCGASRSLVGFYLIFNMIVMASRGASKTCTWLKPTFQFFNIHNRRF